MSESIHMEAPPAGELGGEAFSGEREIPFLLERSERPAWYSFRDPRSPKLDDPRITPLFALPGVGPDANGRVLVPANLALARPDLFAVWPPPSTPKSFLDVPENVDVGLSSCMRPYQSRCIAFAESRPSGSYIGLDVGLGKTRISTATAWWRRKFRKTLVIGPLIARGAWCEPGCDPEKLFQLKITPLEGVKDVIVNATAAFADPQGWFFIHYELLHEWMHWITMRFRPECLIVDEIDVARSQKARYTEVVRGLARLSTVRQRHVLSGTPVHNSLLDLWSQLDTVEPDAWGKRHEFGVRYCSGQKGAYGMIYGEPSNIEELRARMSTVYVFISRRFALNDLPPPDRQRISVTPDSEALTAYNAAKQNIRTYVAALGRPLAPGVSETLAKITILMQQLALSKVDATAQKALEAIAVEGRVVVFSWFQEVVRRVEAILKQAGVQTFAVHTKTPVKKRVAFAQSFGQTTPTAYIATIGSAGASLNGLQVASTIIFNDVWWTPAPIIQAEGRVWRSGQARQVHAFYMCTKEWIDEELIKAILRKAEEADMIDAQGAGDVLSLGVGLKMTEDETLTDFVDELARRLSVWEEQEAA